MEFEKIFNRAKKLFSLSIFKDVPVKEEVKIAICSLIQNLSMSSFENDWKRIGKTFDVYESDPVLFLDDSIRHLEFFVNEILRRFNIPETEFIDYNKIKEFRI